MEYRVADRKIEVLQPISPELAAVLSQSICAQDLYLQLNPDPDNPTYDVEILEQDKQPGQYENTYSVQAKGITLAMVTILRVLQN